MKKGILRILVVLPLLLSLSLVVAQPAGASNPGSLDTTFGGTGKVTTDFGGGNDIIQAVAIQSDGKIVVGGVSYPTPGVGSFALARYNTDGTLDTTGFGTNGTGGKVTTSFGIHTASVWGLAIYKSGPNLGKIVAVGNSTALANSASVFAVARYNPNGTLDTTFDTDGKVTTDFGPTMEQSQAFAVTIQSNDRIVVAGTAVQHPYNIATFQTIVTTGWDMALARYNDNGSPDTSFGGTGTVITDIGVTQYGTGDAASAVVIQPNTGNIVVAGHANPLSQSNSDFALARYLPNGTLDTSFGTLGKTTTDFGGFDVGQSMAVQGDGSLVVAGYMSPSTAQGSPQDFALTRYSANGVLDTGFGTNGKVTTNFNGNDLGQSVAIQSDGKIVVAGFDASGAGSAQDFALARYTTSGLPDTSFGGTGKVTTDFAASPDAGHAMAIQTDGKIVVAGNGGITGDFAVARYNGDTPAPPVPVPGISTYGLAILAGGLVATTFWMQRRFKKIPST